MHFDFELKGPYLMVGRAFRCIVWAAIFTATSFLRAAAPAPQPLASGEELLSTGNITGEYGGRLVVALRAEPKTFNPLNAIDQPSRDIIGRMSSDLLHINAISQQTAPALAKNWKVSPDGLKYTLTLRRGLRFSDGHPFSADDVVFTFKLHLDEKVHSPQRDLLVIGGQPISVRKVNASVVEFQLAKPYAAAERIFDSIAILPEHLLAKTFEDGRITEAWSLNSSPAEIAGMGPFRMKEYVPGQQLVLERNPYFWKVDQKKRRLPYLDELVFLFVPSEDAQVLRFQGGETDLLSRLSAENYAVLEKDQDAKAFQLQDLGPGLEFNFLFFNQNSVLPKDSPALQSKQEWFRQVAFRQAISSAIDRNGIIHLVYRGRATPLWFHVTPANKLWLNQSIQQPQRSIPHARELLKAAGFSWKDDGSLVDAGGHPVEFSIITSASNAQRTKMAAIIQDDLKELGIKVNVVPLEFKAVIDRVFQTHDYEAAILALGGGDVDPNPQMNVWMSNGSSHVWDLAESKPATPWEAEIDRLMSLQLSTIRPKERKKLYDNVQAIVADKLPIICLASPNQLVGAKKNIGNFQPAILDHATLWNVEQLYIKK
ncbi:MAG: ABC transporter substrate-binding protein [Terriglobales bacterium]|jgi:peptide/nickel transport system substrate-binding protein